ncbi:MAG: hypothetical protein ACTSV9_00770 [Candidatus Thorarchaeota archaeon]
MNIDVWRKSLEAMRNSVVSSFELGTLSQEQELFLQAWATQKDIAFIGYRQNDGRRRIRDITETIDDALVRLHDCDYKAAARVYHDTLNRVSTLTLWAHMLESSASAGS